MAVITIEGHDLSSFRAEAGVHRWQRVPPTEKRGRVHTSTITVAVAGDVRRDVVDDADISYRVTRSRGNGGQNVNKRETAVIATHVPTGTSIRCENARTQEANRIEATRLLKERVEAHWAEQSVAHENQSRRKQIGSGSRSESATRTVCVYGGECRMADGRRIPIGQYLKGRHL